MSSVLVEINATYSLGGRVGSLGKQAQAAESKQGHIGLGEGACGSGSGTGRGQKKDERRPNKEGRSTMGSRLQQVSETAGECDREAAGHLGACDCDRPG